MRIAAIPVLPAHDVAASLAWWTTVCGFTETFRDSTPPTYAGLQRDGAHIHLAAVTGSAAARTIGDQTMIRFSVDDVDALYADFQARGGVVHPNGALQIKPWGTREFSATDPNGICVTFMAESATTHKAATH